MLTKKRIRNIIILWLTIVILVSLFFHFEYKKQSQITADFIVLKDGLSSNDISYNIKVINKLKENLNSEEKELLLRNILKNNIELIDNEEFIDYIEQINVSKFGLYSLVGDYYWEKSKEKKAYRYYLEGVSDIRNKSLSTVIIRLKYFPESEYSIYEVYSRLIEYEEKKGNYKKASDYNSELSHILN